MAAPFAACVVLVGIHAYLGMHVIRRGVIFVDLALAQFSAFGAAFGLVLGHELESAAGHVFGGAFALLGAVFFALVRPRHREMPQEAIIGVAYAVASAATILVLDRAPHGAEHTKHLLVGSILWVNWEVVGKLALSYSILGSILWRFHSRIMTVSEGGGSAGLSPIGWDLLFYGIFALVVTSSVQVAGVLLVFTFLIVPTLFALLVVGGVGRRLVTAWAFGVVVTMVGCLISYTFDLPTGAAVVCSFGAALAVSSLIAWAVARARTDDR
jgi:zinc/manganese transport system permease protein